MNVKYKILIILFMLTLPIFSYGISYSLFNSNSTLNSNDQAIAKFIFNAESLDQFQLSLVDLRPGDSKEYPFSVSNNHTKNKSDVSIEYQMTIKTYHLIPFIIELYKLNDDEEELVLTCDEMHTRNPQNELMCTTPIQEMEYSNEKLDNYKLEVQFSNEYNDEIYSDLVDYINIEIKSWQKIKKVKD